MRAVLVAGRPTSFWWPCAIAGVDGRSRTIDPDRSALLSYWLAGRALQPLDGMMSELEAIQDGRSLHRRLAVSGDGDEMGRLGATLNAMLGRVERSFVALRRFTADASHELKTPLMVLRAGVERSLTHRIL